MAKIYINKLSAAQRQFNAAVRIYFDQEDELAVLTLGSAALGICEDVFEKRHPGQLARKSRVYLEEGIRSFIKESGGVPSEDWRLKDSDKKLHTFIKRMRNKPANFLKHADRDTDGLLKSTETNVDDTLAATLALLLQLNIAPSPEQQAFGRWHLVVYPSQPGDELRTGGEEDGRRLFIHDLNKSEQLEAGKILLDLYCE